VTIASILGLDVPKALDAEHQRLSQKLAGLHGKALDEEYMRAMVDDHNKTVMHFEAKERSGHNPELKQFAQKRDPFSRHTRRWHRSCHVR
jgi:predicted outer membrane protein